MTAYWVLWLLAIAVTFGMAEIYAIRTHRMTLSQFVWNLSKKFLPIIFIAGFLVGFLVSHFWWGGMAKCF
jgi:uncharacterized membrane protein YciS (DUF1049 family)